MPCHRHCPRGLAAMLCGVSLSSACHPPRRRKTTLLHQGCLAMAAFLSSIASTSSETLRAARRSETKGNARSSLIRLPILGSEVDNMPTRSQSLSSKTPPTRFLQLELGPTISYYNIRGVPGLNDRNAGVLNGVSAKDVWASGDAYEPYVGRWSRLVGRQFVTSAGVPPNKEWLDVGSGTGCVVRSDPRSCVATSCDWR